VPAGHIGNLSKPQVEALQELRGLVAEQLASPAGEALARLLRGEDYLLTRYLRGTAFVPAGLDEGLLSLALPILVYM
jgi:hypothetical protein